MSSSRRSPDPGRLRANSFLTQLCLSVAVASVPADSLAHRRIKAAPGGASLLSGPVQHLGSVGLGGNRIVAGTSGIRPVPVSAVPADRRPHSDYAAWPPGLPLLERALCTLSRDAARLDFECAACADSPREFAGHRLSRRAGQTASADLSSTRQLSRISRPHLAGEGN
jgi:hypothetical protein